jgi:hypothetical protein
MNSKKSEPAIPNAHPNRLHEKALLASLFAVGFIIRLYPLLRFPRVGYDPFLHYQFSQALLEGKTDIMIVTGLGEKVTLYYPPLFHLLSLIFFLALPTVDPYLIMKVIVCVLDALQVIPIYFIVKLVSKSIGGAAAAGFAAIVAPGDLLMVSWGGYANIAGLLLIAVLAYFIIKEKAVAVVLVSTILFLTHHLSMLFAIALFLPYLLMTWLRTRKLPKCLVAFVAAMGVAYAAFYWQTLIPLYELYTEYASRYAKFTLPPDWPLMLGVPILAMAALGIGLRLYRSKTRLAQSDLLLYMWFLWPILLGYSFVFGVHWDVIRWVYFLQQPACVWCGIAATQFKNRKLIILIFLLAFVIQLVSTIQGYYSDVKLNSGYTY